MENKWIMESYYLDKCLKYHRGKSYGYEVLLHLEFGNSRVTYN